MITKEYISPCGKLLLGVRGRALCLCDWMRGDRISKSLRRMEKYKLLEVYADEDDASLLDRAEKELDEYFAGNRIQFDLPLSPLGTDFQLKVWEELLAVPYGMTCSYRNIASQIGSGLSVRAAANAIGANPLSIFIPCHRIIGSDGSLTGYAGGIEAKTYLLKHEKRLSQL